MPYPARTVSFESGVQAMPMRGAKPHWRLFMRELLAPDVAEFGLLPATSRPELVMVSVPVL